MHKLVLVILYQKYEQTRKYTSHMAHLAITAMGKETLQAVIYVLITWKVQQLWHLDVRSNFIRNTLNLVTSSVETEQQFIDEDKFTKSLPYHEIPENTKKWN